MGPASGGGGAAARAQGRRPAVLDEHRTITQFCFTQAIVDCALVSRKRI